jgi:hypothetical protein
MADPDEKDPHKNNGGVKIGTETDYETWDWRKIQVAITGSVNTDENTAQQKLPETSNPKTLYDSGGHYLTGSNALTNVHDGLKTQTDLLVGPDTPTWTGPAATAFRGLMAKTLAAVKTHADPLAGPPSYLTTMYKAGDALTTAINTASTQNYNAALAVINRWNDEPDDDGASTGNLEFTYPGGNSKGDPPWYDYNGTTIVIISHYPDIDHQLTLDMRTTFKTLLTAYKGFSTDLAEPTGVLPNLPPDTTGNPPIKVNIPPFKVPKPPKQPPTPKPPKPDLTKSGNVPRLDDPALTKGGPGPDGVPLGPDGQPLGPDGQPLGPDGQPLGPDGKPLTGPGAGPDAPHLLAPGGPDGLGGNGLTPPNLINTPNGPALLGPDGKTLLDPKTGKPLIGPDGKPLTLDKLKNPALVPPSLIPPRGGGAPPGFKPVDLKRQPLPKFSPRTLANLEKAGVKPPNLANLVAGGPPAKPGALESEGELKPGAKEFGAPKEGVAGERAAAGEAGRGEPMPMGGGGMGGAGAGGEKDRDRTTWLVEDEEVWGAETALGAGVLGR